MNVLIADAFRILGVMDTVDSRDMNDQLEPVISRALAALEDCRSEVSC